MHGIRRYIRGATLATAYGLLVACVTINIYFPAAAAEKAADRIIEDVWGKPPEAPEAAAPPQSSQAQPMTGLVWLLDLLIPAAQAQQANINIDTPAINRLKGSMAARHRQLEPFYDGGGVGLTQDGLIAVRDLNAVPLAQRGAINQLVAQENQDRNALYQEIARANGHPEWEADIRATFSRQWVANARRGWWYQGRGGWQKK